MTKPEPIDVSTSEDEPPDSGEDFYVPDKPPQIEAWKVPGAEDLPDDVKSDPIPEGEQG